MIDLEWNDPQMKELENFYNILGQDAFYKSHYDLAEISTTLGFSVQNWRDFLTDPRVMDYATQELKLLKQFELNKMLKDMSKNAKSVGTAQNITAMMKSLGENGVQDGPAIIYAYIPLTDKEIQSPQVRVLTEDPFRREV